MLTTYNNKRKEMISGSNHSLPTGALFFESDGSVHLHLSSEINTDDEQSITMAAAYFQYALQREDWLKVFLEEEYVLTVWDKEEEIPFGRHSLRVIQGGLSSGSHPN